MNVVVKPVFGEAQFRQADLTQPYGPKLSLVAAERTEMAGTPVFCSRPQDDTVTWALS